MPIPRDAFFRTRTGHAFLPFFDVKGGTRLTVHHGRGRRSLPHILNCPDGVVGFLISGPKEWSPREDPVGFELSVWIRKGDRLTLYFDGKFRFQPFDEPGRFGLVRHPSPFYDELLTGPKGVP